MEYRPKIDTPELRQALEPFLASYTSTEARIAAIEAALRSEGGKAWREELAAWTVRVLPVELLVPDEYSQWRPLVRDAMMFVVTQLSPSRLAPKVVEQMEAPVDTPPEARLLRFISRVPGLQKIGQCLARNHRLHPRLRGALAELENGISDASFEAIRAIILREAGAKFETYSVKLESGFLSEASVSAVVGFTWQNPQTRRRERGVFKVLKPHIPACYAEDMKILQQLAGYLARKHGGEGVRLGEVAATLTEVRLLLEREVDFPGEQATIANCLRVYRSVPGVRIPRLIKPLSTATVTALTHESGVKVTDASIRTGKLRAQLGQRLAEALVAVPALAWQENVIFHADPHAGNVLYDKRRRELVILDWALTGRLTREQRKNVLMLVIMSMLRDADGMAGAIERLHSPRAGSERAQKQIIRKHVRRLLERLELFGLPGPMDAMQLLDDVALDGVRFPAALLMFRKAWFTLDGVLEDVSKSTVRMDSVILWYALANWASTGVALALLLPLGDWIKLDYSLLTLMPRVCGQALTRSWRRREAAPRTEIVQQATAA